MMLVLGFCHPAIRRGLAAAPAAATQPPRPLRENLHATLKKLSDAGKVEIAQAIVDIEALRPKVVWSFGTITNDCHVGSPYSAGVYVSISGPGNDAYPDGINIFEKHHRSIAAAAAVAIARFGRRAAGEQGA